MYVRSAVISGNQWGDKMPEDKDTLEYWLDDIQITDEARGNWASDIKDLEYKLGYSRNQEAIKSKIEELQERVVECTAELNEYAQKIFGRPAKAEEMKTLLKDKLQKIYQRETIEDIRKYGSDNLTVELSYLSKTTEILDAFHKSKKRFLIFRDLCHMSVFDPYRQVRVNLIVTNHVDCPYIEKSCPTMTEIKRLPTTHIDFEDSYIPDRLEPLAEEIVKIVNRHKNIKMPFTMIFWKPFEIGGQTYSERHSWYGVYGEVASYYAIGVTLKERFY